MNKTLCFYLALSSLIGIMIGIAQPLTSTYGLTLVVPAGVGIAILLLTVICWRFLYISYGYSDRSLLINLRKMGHWTVFVTEFQLAFVLLITVISIMLCALYLSLEASPVFDSILLAIIVFNGFICRAFWRKSKQILKHV